MSIRTLSEQEINQAVHDALQTHGYGRDELIPILQDVNHQLGYLPTLAIVKLSQMMKIPTSQIYSVASFYSMLSTEARGEHVIQFCESAPCHVMGGRQVWNTLLETLGIGPGETTPDGKWTLITTSCLGVCGVGPVMIVDDEVYGNLTPQRTRDILAQIA